MVKNFVYFLVFVLAVIAAAELIGIQTFSIESMNISMLPLVFAIAIAMILALPFLRKGILKKIYSKKNVDFASKYLIFIMLPLMADMDQMWHRRFGKFCRLAGCLSFRKLVTLVLFLSDCR